LLKQLVHRLRLKLGGDEPGWIETIPNVGYRLRLR
jgi:DNA-binding response OmpR family regulator